MKIAEVEEGIVRRKRGRPRKRQMVGKEVTVQREDWRPRKRQRVDKACPQAKATKLSAYGSREKCLVALAEPAEAVGTDLQIVGTENVCCDMEFAVASFDSEYRLFLDNLRVVENQLLLENNDGYGGTRFLEYEVGDEPHEPTVTGNKKKKIREMRDAKKERTVGASNRPRSENGRLGGSLCNPRIVPDIRKGKGDVRRGRKSSVSKKNAELEAKPYDSCQRKSRSNRQPIVEELNLEACKNRTEKHQDMEDYTYYLKHMVDALRNSSLIPQNVPQRKCDIKTKSPLDSDIIAIDDKPFPDGDHTPFVAAKNYNVLDVDEEIGGSGQICSSWFRKELMEALRKPYSEKELHKLSGAASIRKPKTRARELRDGRVISYKVDILGKSYLHHAPDFRNLFMRWFGSTKFKCLLQLSLKDRHRALNLLRGFFFYMKNVVHEEAFRPWMDAECLKTMPRMRGKAKVTRTD